MAGIRLPDLKKIRGIPRKPREMNLEISPPNFVHRGPPVVNIYPCVDRKAK